jgi:diacylglycerol O-acyltransferase / wax synthase
MGDRLTPLDASFLELEESDESSRMHVGWAMLFDPLPEGGAPTLGRVQELIDRRLELLPRFRQRLSSARAGALSWPSWQPDPGFEVADHVGRATLPAPGGEAELLDWLGDFYSRRLDRDRPLWEVILLDGLAGGGWAIAGKVHHSLVDGIGGSSVTTAMLDAEPRPGPGSMGLLAQLEVGEEDEDRRGWIATQAESARAEAGGAGAPRRLGALLERSRATADALIDEIAPAPATSLDVEIGAERRLAAVDVPLAELRRVRDALGGSVDDVVFAAIAGGLRGLFEARGERLEADSVRALVPVSMRRAGERLAHGGRVSSLFLDLPVGEPDPLWRHRTTVAASRALREAGRARSGGSPVGSADISASLIRGAVARFAFAPRVFNLAIANLTGLQVTLYALGAPLRRVVPVVPIFARHAVAVAVVGYDGGVTFGIDADRGAVPDLDVLRDGIERSLAELEQLATEVEDRAA